MEQPNITPEAQPELPAGFIEKEVELKYFDNYEEQTAGGGYLASCQRIRHCSCDCNRCGFVVIS